METQDTTTEVIDTAIKEFHRLLEMGWSGPSLALFIKQKLDEKGLLKNG